MPGRSAIVGLLEEVNRAGKRAARRAARVYTRSVHVHQAVEPSSPASPAPLHAQEVESSYLWSNFIRMTLNENLRVPDDDNNFKEWLLNIGEGKSSNSYEEENELIHIPDEITTIEEDIITEIYGN